VNTIKIKEQILNGMEGRCEITDVHTQISPYIEDDEIRSGELVRYFLKDPSGRDGFIKTTEEIGVKEGGYIHIKGGEIIGKEVSI